MSKTRFNPAFDCPKLFKTGNYVQNAPIHKLVATLSFIFPEFAKLDLTLQYVDLKKEKTIFIRANF